MYEGVGQCHPFVQPNKFIQQTHTHTYTYSNLKGNTEKRKKKTYYSVEERTKSNLSDSLIIPLFNINTDPLANTVNIEKKHETTLCIAKNWRDIGNNTER